MYTISKVEIYKNLSQFSTTTGLPGKAPKVYTEKKDKKYTNLNVKCDNNFFLVD